MSSQSSLTSTKAGAKRKDRAGKSSFSPSSDKVEPPVDAGAQIRAKSSSSSPAKVATSAINSSSSSSFSTPAKVATSVIKSSSSSSSPPAKVATSATKSSPVSSSSCSGSGKRNESVEEFEFFYGKASPFSQHYKVSFELGGLRYNCAEQYMMHQKAVLFKDGTMARNIMATSNPVEQKRLGRKVQNFDKDRWAKRSLEVVREASYAKFSQNEDLLKQLMATQPRTLVEASPRDRLWGIGLGASNPKAKDPSQWRGKNLLGKILTKVREELKQDQQDTQKPE